LRKTGRFGPEPKVRSSDNREKSAHGKNLDAIDLSRRRRFRIKRDRSHNREIDAAIVAA
jgi:hypothetical protein